MLQNGNIFRALEVFLRSPNKRHYLMDISRKVGIAHTSIKKDLKKLIKLRVINELKEKRGTRVFPTYKAEAENKVFKKYKIVYNISSILDSGLINFIDDALTPKSIVLFGSYLRGEDNENSDIDLFIECKKEKLNLKKFEKKLGRKIELHFKENFRSYPKELKNNIINGFVLNGFLEGYK